LVTSKRGLDRDGKADVELSINGNVARTSVITGAPTASAGGWIIQARRVKRARRSPW